MPLLVSAVCYWLGGKVWHSQNLRFGAAVLMLLSTFAVLPLEMVDRPPFTWRMTYFLATSGF